MGQIEKPQGGNQGLKVRLEAVETTDEEIGAVVERMAADLGLKIVEGEGGTARLAQFLQSFRSCDFRQGFPVTIQPVYLVEGGNVKLRIHGHFANPNLEGCDGNRAQTATFQGYFRCEPIGEEEGGEMEVVAIGRQSSLAGFAAVIASNIPGEYHNRDYHAKLEKVINPYAEAGNSFAVLKAGKKNVLLISNAGNYHFGVVDMLDLDNLDETVDQARSGIWKKVLVWLGGSVGDK